MYTTVKALMKDQSLEISAITLNPGKLAEQLKSAGIKVHVLDESVDNFLRLRRKVAGILGTGKCDIIHSHRYKENILAGSIKAKCGITGLIQTIHGVIELTKGFAGAKARFYSALNRFYTRRHFEKIVPVSEDIRHRLRKYYPESRLVTIHNAIDPDIIKPSKSVGEIRREFGIEQNAPIIGATGRMVPVKGFDLFLKMAVEILKHRPDTRFMLVGDGPLRQSLHDTAVKMGIDSNVIFPGFRDDVLDLMNAFDIFVISSFHEGVPMALLEAMSLKKAVVSTAVGGVKEVIQNEKSGLLVRPESVEELSTACLKILANNELRKELENGAVDRIRAEFSDDILAKKLSGLYRELVS